MKITISVFLLIFGFVGSLAALPQQQRRFEDATLPESYTNIVESTSGLPKWMEKAGNPKENARPVVTSRTMTVTVPSESAPILTEVMPKVNTEVSKELVTKTEPTEVMPNVMPNGPSFNIPSSIDSYSSNEYTPPYIRSRFQPVTVTPTKPQFQRVYLNDYPNFYPKCYDNFYYPCNILNSNQNYPGRSFNIPFPSTPYAYGVNLRTPPYANFNPLYNQPNPPVFPRVNFNDDYSQPPSQSLPDYQNPYFNEPIHESTDNNPSRNFNQPSNEDVYHPSSQRVPTNELGSKSSDEKHSQIASFIRNNADQLANEILSFYTNKYDITPDVNVNDPTPTPQVSIVNSEPSGGGQLAGERASDNTAERRIVFLDNNNIQGHS